MPTSRHNFSIWAATLSGFYVIKWVKCCKPVCIYMSYFNYDECKLTVDNGTQYGDYTSSRARKFQDTGMRQAPKIPYVNCNCTVGRIA